MWNFSNHNVPHALPILCFTCQTPLAYFSFCFSNEEFSFTRYSSWTFVKGYNMTTAMTGCGIISSAQSSVEYTCVQWLAKGKKWLSLMSKQQ